MNPNHEAAQPVRVPGLNLLKRAADPLLAGTPDWLHAVLWAMFVLALLYALMYWLFRHGLPWASNALTPPVRVVIEFGGVALLLPGYVVSTLIRRARGGVPGFLFVYDDLVHNATRACHWTAAKFLHLLAGLRKTSKVTLAVLLIVLTGFWDVSYCAGAGKECRIPTSQWIENVSRAMDSPKPAPTSTPCPKKKHAKKCTPTHHPRG